jgi:hypothetical protein
MNTDDMESNHQENVSRAFRSASCEFLLLHFQ